MNIPKYFYFRVKAKMHGTAIEVEVEDASNEDVVEVVRCKDCKHRPVMVWSEVYDDFDVLAPVVDGKEDWRCPCLIEDDPYYSWSPNDNWFCGNGERRESDGVCK